MITHQGGVIIGPNIRIQGRHIIYLYKTDLENPRKFIQAEGDLLVDYQGYLFSGNKLFYDLQKKIGFISQGKALANQWFIEGKEIHLFSDGSFQISQGYLTTDLNINPWWKMESSSVTISKKGDLYASNLKPYFLRIPIFWIPSLNTDLNSLKNDPFRFKLLWNRLSKERVAIRYKFYSSPHLNLSLKADYSLSHDLGIGLETRYQSLDTHLYSQTNSYAYLEHEAPKPYPKYRLQGTLNKHSDDKKSQTYLSYDFLNDKKMLENFEKDPFKSPHVKRTLFSFGVYQNNYLFNFVFQPCLNSFQTFNQYLPLLYLRTKPEFIPNTSWLHEHCFSGGYFQYHFGDCSPKLPSYSSGRFETSHQIYRNFSLGAFSITPRFKLKNIYYTQTPGQLAKHFWIQTYSVYLQTALKKKYTAYDHFIFPYLLYEEVHAPNFFVDRHYIFSLKDGMVSQNFLKIGVIQLLSSQSLFPKTICDLYFPILLPHNFWPKMHLMTEISHSSWRIFLEAVYNLVIRSWDRQNIGYEATFSERCAGGIELRYRSAMDWKKLDESNYNIEQLYSLNRLLSSPLSDSRTTLLTKLHIKLTPVSRLHFVSAHGWRCNEASPYHVYEIKFSSFLSGNWLFEIGYQSRPVLKQWIFPAIKLVSSF